MKRVRLKKRTKKLIDDATSSQLSQYVRECTFPDQFEPHPGAQETVFSDFFSLSQAKPHPYTVDAARKVLWYRGGLNSGKSFSGGAFICSCALKDSEARLLITANSYGQLKTSTLVALAEFCKMFGVPLEPCADIPMEDSMWADLTAKKIADSRLCKIFDSPVLVLSAEAFTGRTERSQEVGRGLQVRAFWADEFAYAPESAFNTIMGRLGRGPGILPGIGMITSSINKNNPYNWAYDLFDAPNRSDQAKIYYRSVRGSSKENLHADSGYVESMEATLTDELIKIELEGEYATVTKGIIYNTFSRDNHSFFGERSKAIQYQYQVPIHISIDFNHDPACAIAAQLVKDELLILQEWYLSDSDTFELAAEIAQWISERHRVSRHSEKLVLVHGDATGKQKTANSKKTNWQIVWDALTASAITGQKCYRKSNPSVIDSINALKISLKNNRVFVNGNHCPELVKDLEVLKWSGQDIDKRDIKRSHLQDCLRYLNWDIWPYNQATGRPARKTRQISGVVV